jgi:hypothetical protein
MDVLAMKKEANRRRNSIERTPTRGEFARCMGYVEQFDTQSPQLTIHDC